MRHADVIIVGGGPGGAACAMHLRAAGVDCLVLDKAIFPRHKTCAGWITPDVFTALGATPEDYTGDLTHYDRFHIAIKGLTIHPRVNQYAIRRVQFDEWLLKRAGVTVIKHQAVHIQPVQSGFEIDQRYHCEFLIGAGGTHCPVRRSVFGDSNWKAEDLITAMETEIPYTYHDRDCHLWFLREGLPGYAWYVPKKGGYLNIGVGGKQEKFNRMGVDIRFYWQRLEHWLAQERLVKGVRFHPRGLQYSLRGKNTNIQRGSAYLIGDAAGLATRDMGEGIRAAVLSGIAAARSISDGVPYSVRHFPKYSFPALISR